ncbi:MAG: hypothetical protein M3336_07790 [Chloroflexota bacterium]|nr:hypothetical protein [Chloroflexota bacterium]
MSDVLVYATLSHAAGARSLLTQACRATGISAQLELFGSGSLFQRLRARRSPPPPDLIMWSGPYAAHAAAIQDLVLTYQPSQLPQHAMHDPTWHWVAVDFQPASIQGDPALASFSDVDRAASLAIPDPERSEAGMQIALAVLDRARQYEGGEEQGWRWWQRRAELGLAPADDGPAAVERLRAGRASHALTLEPGGAPLAGLAPVPQALSLGTSSSNLDQARRMLDWLVGPDAGLAECLSAWRAASNGLSSLFESAPPLDVDWGTRQYTLTRQRWSQTGVTAWIG